MQAWGQFAFAPYAHEAVIGDLIKLRQPGLEIESGWGIRYRHISSAGEGAYLRGRGVSQGTVLSH